MPYPTWPKSRRDGQEYLSRLSQVKSWHPIIDYIRVHITVPDHTQTGVATMLTRATAPLTSIALVIAACTAYAGAGQKAGGGISALDFNEQTHLKSEAKRS